MDAFLLVYLISAIAESDGLGRTEGLACLAAYAPVIYIVNPGSSGGNARYGRVGFSCFSLSMYACHIQKQWR